MRRLTPRALWMVGICCLVLVGCGEDGSTPMKAVCEGKADGTPCGDPLENACTHADTCAAGVCVRNDVARGAACGNTTDGSCDHADVCDGMGSCDPNYAEAGATCGDSSDTECDKPDSCDGRGGCLMNRVAANTACGDPTVTDCDLADTCDGAGACKVNLVAADTACGDPTVTDCDRADTCDGAGACKVNLVAANTACGDPTDTDCNHADTCDGAGACKVNLVAVDTACGDPTDSECDNPDTCDGAGTCLPRYEVAFAACGSNGDTECDDPDSCDGAGACAPRHAAVGTTCGDTSTTDCDQPDSCDGSGACEPRHVADGTACYDCPAGMGLCDVCTGASCNDAAYCTLANTPLMASNTAGNNHRGNMFDLHANNTLTITSFDASPMGNTTIEIYYKKGTWNGFANDPSAWTLVGSAPTPYTGGFSAVAVPVNVTIPAGETYAFYVTSNTMSVSLNYSNGTGVGNVYSSDANLVFMEGGGMEYPFTQGTGAVYQPRVWNGNIHYVLPQAGVGTVAAAHSGTVVDGAMFDLQASDDATLASPFEIELASGTFDVDVYFRRGTFVGNESSPGGWELAGHLDDVVSAGGGARTLLYLRTPIYFSNGEVVSFYVATSGDGLRVDPASAAGGVVATAGNFTMHGGNAVDTAFNGIGPASTARIVLSELLCQ